MADGEEIVHIIPLGHEFDRAVKPFEKRFKAHRVHLLSIAENKKYPPDMTEKQKYFLKSVKENLEEKGIGVLFHEVDMFDVLDVMKIVSKLIILEKTRKNIVYVNMSACGRLTSVGATLAAMAHGARVYYVVADRYSRDEREELQHGLSVCESGNLRIVFLENFQILLPDEAALKILAHLCEKEKGMETTEILKLLRDSQIEGFEEDYTKLIGKEKRRLQQIYLIRLDKRILDKLERSGYIIKQKRGKYNTIKITESGKYIAHISGLLT